MSLHELFQLTQQIEDTFAENELNHEEKAEKINKICCEIKNLQENDFQRYFSFFDQKLCDTINNHIEHFTQQSEFALLHLLEICQKSQIFELYTKNINYSRIFEKIKAILINKVEIEEKLNQTTSYSDMTEQLTICCLLILPNFKNEQQIMEICTKVLIKKISVFVKTAQKLNEQLSNNKELEIQKEKDLNIDIFKYQEITRQVGLLMYEYADFLNKQTKIHEIIIPLIHINCPLELQCPHRIGIKKKYDLKSFHRTIIKFINKIRFEKIQDFQQLIKEHNLIDHIFPFIAEYINYLQIDNKLKQQEEYYQLFSVSTYLKDVLKLSSKIIIASNETSSSFINLIPAIMLLTKYDKQSIDSSHIIFAFEIRFPSLQLLNNIFISGDFAIKSKLIREQNYIDVLHEAIGSCSGSGEHGEVIISQGLQNETRIFQYILEDKQLNQQYELLKDVEEQMIELCGEEDIESILFKLDNNYNYIKYAKQLKEVQLNRFKDTTNLING